MSREAHSIPEPLVDAPTPQIGALAYVHGVPCIVDHVTGAGAATIMLPGRCKNALPVGLLVRWLGYTWRVRLPPEPVTATTLTLTHGDPGEPAYRAILEPWGRIALEGQKMPFLTHIWGLVMRTPAT